MTAVEELLERKQADMDYELHVARRATEQALLEELGERVMNEAVVTYDLHGATLEFAGFDPVCVHHKVNADGRGWRLDYFTLGLQPFKFGYHLEDVLVMLDSGS